MKDELISQYQEHTTKELNQDLLELTSLCNGVVEPGYDPLNFLQLKLMRIHKRVVERVLKTRLNK